MCCPGPPPSAGVCAGELTTLPAGRQGESQQRPPESVGQGGCGQQQDGPSGPRLSLETPCPLQLGEVGGRIRAREPALLPEDGQQGVAHIGRHVLGVAGRAGRTALSTAGVPTGPVPPTTRGPGSPCQVEVGAPAVQQLPHQRPECPEPVLHVQLLLLRGGGRSEPAPWAPRACTLGAPARAAPRPCTHTCSREKAVTRVRQPLACSCSHSASQ